MFGILQQLSSATSVIPPNTQSLCLTLILRIYQNWIARKPRYIYIYTLFMRIYTYIIDITCIMPVLALLVFSISALLLYHIFFVFILISILISISVSSSPYSYSCRTQSEIDSNLPAEETIHHCINILNEVAIAATTDRPGVGEAYVLLLNNMMMWFGRYVSSMRYMLYRLG